MCGLYMYVLFLKHNHSFAVDDILNLGHFIYIATDPHKVST